PSSTPLPYTTLFRSHVGLDRHRPPPRSPEGFGHSFGVLDVRGVGNRHRGAFLRKRPGDGSPNPPAATGDEDNLVDKLHATMIRRSEEHTSELQSRFD